MDRVGMELRPRKRASSTQVDPDQEHAMSPATAQYGSRIGGIEMQPDMVGSRAHDNVARRDFSQMTPSAEMPRSDSALCAVCYGDHSPMSQQAHLRSSLYGASGLRLWGISKPSQRRRVRNATGRDWSGPSACAVPDGDHHETTPEQVRLLSAVISNPFPHSPRSRDGAGAI